MVDLPLTPAKLRYYSWHKWGGVTIFLLSALRLTWMVMNPAPTLPSAMPEWQQRAAHASHRLLYIFFFAAPLTGWLFSSATGFPVVYFGVLQLPDLIDKNGEAADVFQAAHRWINFSLASLVVLHVAAAVKHHLVDRDDILVRMLPFLKTRNMNP